MGGFTHSPQLQEGFLNRTKGKRSTRLSVFGCGVCFFFLLKLFFFLFFFFLFYLCFFSHFSPFLFFLLLLPSPLFFSFFFPFSFIFLFLFSPSTTITKHPKAGGAHSVRCCSVAPLFPVGGHARREPPALCPHAMGRPPSRRGCLAGPDPPLLSADRGYDKRRQGSERI